jgi:hypothetical protein
MPCRRRLRNRSGTRTAVSLTPIACGGKPREGDGNRRTGRAYGASVGRPSAPARAPLHRPVAELGAEGLFPLDSSRRNFAARTWRPTRGVDGIPPSASPLSPQYRGVSRTGATRVAEGNPERAYPYILRAWQSLANSEWAYTPSVRTLQAVFEDLYDITAGMLQWLGSAEEARALTQKAIALLGETEILKERMQIIEELGD